MKFRDSEEYARECYIVHYHFASSSYLATLELTYINEVPEKQIIDDVEREFLTFIEKYPLPLMASAFDAKGDLINLESKGEWPHLCGHLNDSEKIVYGWKYFSEASIPSFQKEEDYRDKVYENIPFKTSEELKRKAIKEQKIQVLAIRIFVLLLTIIIPLAWLIGGLLYSAIAFLSTLWAFSVLIFKTLKFWGIIKENKATQEKREKERRMAHHDYHCCLNPEGFERLRNENWEKEQRQKIKDEYQELANSNCGTHCIK